MTTQTPVPSSGPEHARGAATDEPVTHDHLWWERYRGWPTWAHVLTAVGVSFVLVLAAALAGAVHLYRNPLPQTSGEIELAGLDAAVEVFRDEHGVPQVYADTDADLVRAQGYVHAQERFFEMDVRRHATAGRLAELFGSDGLSSDKMVRTMGWRRVAQAELGLVSAETRGLLDAYADGVNAYLSRNTPGEIALEYTLLGLTGLEYVPEKWSAVDSLAWLKAMAWDLRGNMDDEIARAVSALDNDEDAVATLWPAYDAQARRPIVTEGRVVDGRFTTTPPGEDVDTDGRGVGVEPATAGRSQGSTGSTGSKGGTDSTGSADGTDGADDTGAGDTAPADAAEAVRAALDGTSRALDGVVPLLGTGEGLGSNAWAVSGERSATGKPLLANDPHLGTSQPGIWTQMGLHCRTVSTSCTLDVSGFTFAGFPGVIIGHNGEIAWGFTNLDPDVTDLYLEKVEGNNVLRDGESVPLEVRTELIEVRGEDDFVLRVRETVHGPLVSDVDQDASSVGANAALAAPEPEPGSVDADFRGPYAVSLAWTALTPGTTADAVFAMNRADDWDSFRAAAELFEVPAQNLVYADRAGNIGYQAPGRVPLRRKGHDGRTPAAGWDSRNDWTGKFVPYDALPSVLNPSDGLVVTANQAVVDDDYPYFLSDDWDRGYRAQRIRDLLEEEPQMSVERMAEIQLDAHNPAADVLVPRLLELRGLDAYVREGVDLLADWDRQDDADSAAAAFFNLTWEQVMRRTFDDDLRARVRPTGNSRWVQVVTDLLERPDDPFWDDRSTEGVVEDRDAVLRDSLSDARREITRRQSVRPSEWTWGHHHRLDLTHSTLGTSGIGFVERLFNRDGHEVSGGPNDVNATAWDSSVGTGVTSAPSMRMVVSLGDLDDSRWVNLTGVSGHPASPHYDDQTELYVRGETLPWRWSRQAVTEASEEKLVLTPQD